MPAGPGRARARLQGLPAALQGRFMSHAERAALEIGAYGWQRVDWARDFYPEDMPDDWRLAFYANEFVCVCVPAAYWQQGGCDVGQWIEDAHERFRFFLEIDASVCEAGAWASLAAALPRFGGQLGGAWLRFGAAEERERCARRLLEVLPELTLFASEADGDAAPGGAILAPRWFPGKTQSDVSAAPGVAFVRLEATPGPRQLRELVEWVAAGGGHGYWFLDAPVPVLRDVQEMARLLGV